MNVEFPLAFSERAARLCWVLHSLFLRRKVEKVENYPVNNFRIHNFYFQHWVLIESFFVPKYVGLCRKHGIII